MGNVPQKTFAIQQPGEKSTPCVSRRFGQPLWTGNCGEKAQQKKSGKHVEAAVGYEEFDMGDMLIVKNSSGSYMDMANENSNF